MIARVLANLSQTPRFEKDMRAFDVTYRTPEGDKQTAVLTRGDAEVGEQIRHVLFAEHPEASDYTFSEFDYLAFQGRAALSRAIEVTMFVQNERGELER